MTKAQMPIPFYKMNGAGNDFIVIDHRRPLIDPAYAAEFARLVCRRRFSVGADGLLLIEPSETADFRWQFFNSDGSIAEMCGNGARCAARFANLHGIAPAAMRFETLAGIIEATVDGTEVALKMTRPFDFFFDRELQVAGETILLHGVNTGVPHAVAIVDRVADVDVVALGSQIRHHQTFMPAGTNANFIERDRDRLLVRTYERGVEGETLACGTGCVAAALIATLRLGMSSPVPVITSGGELLTISFQLEPGPEASQVILKGPAHIVCKGELTGEALVSAKR